MPCWINCAPTLTARPRWCATICWSMTMSLAASQKAELQLLRSRVEQALNRYGENAPQKEKEAVQSLQQHAESYWTSLAPALDWNRIARREQGEMYLRNTIIPRRDEVVQFVKQVNALDERVLDAAEERIQVVQARFQSRVRAISTLALALGRHSGDCGGAPRAASRRGSQHSLQRSPGSQGGSAAALGPAGGGSGGRAAEPLAGIAR